MEGGKNKKEGKRGGKKGVTSIVMSSPNLKNKDVEAAEKTAPTTNPSGEPSAPKEHTHEETSQNHHDNRAHTKSKQLPRGPHGTPNTSYLEPDDEFLPPVQFEALQKQMSTGDMGPIIAAVASAHRNSLLNPTSPFSPPGSPMSPSPQGISTTNSSSGAEVEGLNNTFVLSPHISVDEVTADGTAVPPHLLLSSKRIRMSALCPKLRQKRLRPLLIKTLRATLINFLYVALGRFIIGISKSLLRSGLSGSKFLRLARRETFTANPFKWGAVAAGLSCYRLFQQLVLRLSPNMPVAVSCAVGGGLASLPLAVLNIDTRTELGLYLGVRAIHGAICSNWDNIPMPESWRKFKDWTVIYMVLLAIEILYTFSFHPETHSPGYVKFVAGNTKSHPDTMHCLAALVRRHHTPYFVKMYKSNGQNIVTPEFAQMAAEGVGGCVMQPGARIMNVNDLREACVFNHSYTNSCVYNYLNLSFRHFWTNSVPLYLPLKLSTTLLFGFKRFAKKPLQTMRRILTSSFTSSAFLTLYAVIPQLMLCTAANLQVHSPVTTCLMASVCGFSTYLEPVGRRIDLALYCSMHGLRSFVNLLHVKGLIPKPTSEWIFWLQTIAVAALFYQYDEHFEHIHPNVRGACGWLLKERRCTREDVEHALAWQDMQNNLKEVIRRDEKLMSTVAETAATAANDAERRDAQRLLDELNKEEASDKHQPKEEIE